MSVARLATFDEAPVLDDDDERRDRCESSCNRFLASSLDTTCVRRRLAG
jgi:hypothetical protein